jgi:bla regulator protein blaR1
MKKIVLILLGSVVSAIPVLGQAPQEPKPKFEVATIKPSDPGQRGSRAQVQPGGRVVISGVPVRDMMALAYRVRDFQITGGPGWLATDGWDIEARAEAGSFSPPTAPPDPNTPDPMSIRLQSLLEDRFQLNTHRETKDLPIYELSVAKGGSKIKLSDDQTFPAQVGAPISPPQAGTVPRGGMRRSPGTLNANAVQVSVLAMALSQLLGRTVTDKTGLQGLYDLKLQWALDAPPAAGKVPEAPPDSNAPSIFTALQEQLGLKLDSAKGPVEIIVVDSVQKPTEN